MKVKTFASWSLIILVAFFVPAAHAQTFSVIHTFQGPEGRGPAAGVTLRGGILWGTTGGGGDGDFGTVYQLISNNNTWSLVDIVISAGSPLDRAIFGPDGHLYTAAGRWSAFGSVVNLTPPLAVCKTAKCFWTENDLYDFQASPSDGAIPSYGDLTWDQQGNIYGTTQYGGSNNTGVVYQLKPPVPPSKTWTESVILDFTGPDGFFPFNGVILDSSGNLLGTAKGGGAYGCGVVYKLTPYGNGWSERNAYEFQCGDDGQNPIGGLVSDSSGNLYGTTSAGGSGGGGTVFELRPSGDSYTFKLLYSFSGQEGWGPWASLTMDAGGSLYGTTYRGGAGAGSVFKLTNTQNGWAYASLHDFAGGSEGYQLISNVTIDANGNLYGTAEAGGTWQGGCAVNGGCGVVWMIKP
jgi:uncharacterized repeat protein (TIGR03803 family)